MKYRSLRECVDDLAKTKHLVKIDHPVDPNLEIAEIQRRLYQADGPAVYFSNVKGCKFPVLCNLFGSKDRVHYIFRDTLEAVKRFVQLKIDPAAYQKSPWNYLKVCWSALSMLPKKITRGPVIECQTTIDQLPQIKSWPDDGGAFITLPQVYSENVEQPGIAKSNLGMYRVQLSGGEYETNQEIGMHYQIHRGIGVHHAAAIKQRKKFPVNIFVGGTPAMTFSAVMPLPEGFPELYFGGALSGKRIRMIHQRDQLPIYADADFCISGYIDPEKQLPEGPFGDHLGYYSLAHDFPVLRVEKVYHRKDAIWLYTAVGRPPQEDTMFGEIIHELTGPAIPSVIAGVKSVHAVDAAGVHPLLLAIGSERYVPYRDRKRPQELLTQANAILGQGQLSLAKYLLIIAHEDNPNLEIDDIPNFFQHLLERVDWKRDLHFQTCTTIDTLDYSGSGFNEGSKVVIAAVGEKQRDLPTEIPADFSLPDGFRNPKVCLPGIIAIQSPGYESSVDAQIETFCKELDAKHAINQFPFVIMVDDSEFCAQTLNNFLWMTFTRSNPANDVYGIESHTEHKHWGCRGSLVIDARLKPHHAPPLIENPEVTKRVNDLAASGKPLHGLI